MASGLKVLLVQSLWLPPGVKKDRNPVYPLGLVYVADAIPEKHEVRILDLCVEDHPWKALRESVSAFSPDIVGISIRNSDSFGYTDVVSSPDASTSFCLTNLQRTLDEIDAAGFQGKVVVGGQAFSIFPERIMESSGRVDFGVFLEGEDSFRELLDNLEEPDKVKGIYFRREDEVVFTGPRAHADISSLIPDRSMVHYGRYTSSPEGIGIQSKRGCVLSCSYCIYPHLSGSRLRLCDPVSVVDEMERLSAEGIEVLHFVDPVFNIPKHHAEGICREIIRRELDVKWIAWFHPAYMDSDFVSLCSRAGCVKFELSPDAYGQRGLDALNKKMTTAQVRQSLRLARHLPEGAVMSYNFLINHPGETVFSFFRKLFFCFRIRMTCGGRGQIQLLNHIRIMPGTGVHRTAIEEGRIGPDTEMLPKSQEELFRLFYRRSRSVDAFYRVLMFLSRLKHRFFRS